MNKTSPRSGSQAGFSLIEVLIGSSVLAIALLGHGASLFSEQKLSQEERTRSAALLTMDQFMERMRSDTDFDTLYVRLLTLQELSARSPIAGFEWYEEVAYAYQTGAGVDDDQREPAMSLQADPDESG